MFVIRDDREPDCWVALDENIVRARFYGPAAERDAKQFVKGAAVIAAARLVVRPSPPVGALVALAKAVA